MRPFEINDGDLKLATFGHDRAEIDVPIATVRVPAVKYGVGVLVPVKLAYELYTTIEASRIIPYLAIKYPYANRRIECSFDGTSESRLDGRVKMKFIVRAYESDDPRIPQVGRTGMACLGEFYEYSRALALELDPTYDMPSFLGVHLDEGGCVPYLNENN